MLWRFEVTMSSSTLSLSLFSLSLSLSQMLYKYIKMVYFGLAFSLSILYTSTFLCICRYLTSKKKGKKNITEEGVKEFAKTERVRFGDVVQQPPSLSSKPRKAPEQTSAKLVSSMKLPPGATAGTAAAGGDGDGETSATAAPPKARVDPKQKAGAPSPKSIKCKKSKDMTPHERERLEAVRANAIQLYRQHKKQQLEQRASHR
eukprot:scpid88167/ scgid2075/ 